MTAKMNMNDELKSQASAMGKASAAKLTPEQRKERARKAGQASGAKRHVEAQQRKLAEAKALVQAHTAPPETNQEVA